jgi:BON domain
MGNTRMMARVLQVALAATLLSFGAGCKKQDTQPAAGAPAMPTDQQMAADIASKINAEGALSGQSIQSSVENGQATLTGTVTDEASRTLASRDAATVNGVKTVINNLVVVPTQAAVVAPPPPPLPVAPTKAVERKPAPVKNAAPPPQPQVVQETAKIAPPPPPPPPPKSVTKTVTVASGTPIPIRMTDSLETGQIQANDVFHATLATDLTADGMVAIPRGASVLGRVVEAKDATHYAGSSALTLELTQINSHGQTFHLITDPYAQEGKGRGANTAKKVGGGAAIGALIGALAGGGKGAAIGAAAGGGVGAGANTITKGEQVKIPSETLINFRLQSPISVTVTTHANQDAMKSYDSGDAPAAEPTLQQR